MRVINRNPGHVRWHLIISLFALGIVLAVLSSCTLPLSSTTTIPQPSVAPQPTLSPRSQSVLTSPGFVIHQMVGHDMTGQANELYIYPDGSVIFIQKSGLRFPAFQNPSRTTSVGKIPNSRLQDLLEYLSSSGLDKLQANYNTGDNPGAHFFLEVNFGTFRKSVSAERYAVLDLPAPLYNIYQRLTEISLATTIVSTESIPDPRTRLKLEITAMFSKKSYLPGDTVRVHLDFTNKDTETGIISPFPPLVKVLCPPCRVRIERRKRLSRRSVPAPAPSLSHREKTNLMIYRGTRELPMANRQRQVGIS